MYIVKDYNIHTKQYGQLVQVGVKREHIYYKHYAIKLQMSQPLY